MSTEIKARISSLNGKYDTVEIVGIEVNGIEAAVAYGQIICKAYFDIMNNDWWVDDKCGIIHDYR